MKNAARIIAAVTLGATLSMNASAFDGWYIESATPVPGQGGSWDYLALDEGRQHLFIGHRSEGLKVFDLQTQKMVSVVPQTQSGSSNGATLMPDLDLGVSNNQDGTLTPFRLSTLEVVGPVIKLGAGLDNSHYDAATHRLIVNMEPEKNSAQAELIVLQAPALHVIGKIAVPSAKPEHADSDGKGILYMAARDVDQVFRIDMRTMKLTATWPTPGCGQTNSLVMDVPSNRLFLGCRGRGQTKPTFAVMDSADGKVIYTHEIGGGNDGLIYDRDLKRVFLSNSVHAVLNVFEQVDANTYRPIEAVGTRANVRTMAMDSRNKKIYSFTAQGSADYAKPVTTSVSPFYANTFVPDTFTVLTIARRR
ncbi:hypothetical protein G7048_28235 (plasmid) [Diaphorobacter sp. HDW4B]|uniref:YncE family protein n=1 Tax=Diaphorobacter sp. HDW4B TaxID=2714925 RepID=UPI0014079573|nr:hypothetical protein [Diaphorobacter sp. HDW4B]QIL74350.1 hypothetical protein G7048_28235 [Diaphorobacter sp. HDW4B]